VRHGAWYHAPLRPPPEDSAKTARQHKAAAPPATRIAKARTQRKRPDWQPDMPPVPPCAEQLLAWLFDAGPCMPGANGPVPLSAQELQAWQRGQCLRLSPWQERTLRRLSRAYAAELVTAAAPDAPAPWDSGGQDGARVDIALDMRAQMRALAAD